MDQSGDDGYRLVAVWEGVMAFLREPSAKKRAEVIELAQKTHAYGDRLTSEFLDALIEKDEMTWAWTLHNANQDLVPEELRLLQEFSPWRDATLMSVNGARSSSRGSRFASPAT